MSSADHRARIAAAFGRAESYDEAAIVQHEAAVRLATRIADLPLPANPTILEIGCGTGFLTRTLAPMIGPARWTVSDVAPEMVERARSALDLAADYKVIDGEAIDPALGPFDLIVSNMAFQWFADLPDAVARLPALLAPGGAIAFSTMAAGSFAEWAAVLAEEGRTTGTPAYPDKQALAALVPPGFSGEIDLVDFAQAQPDARSFLRRLKAIGAATPAPAYRQLSGAVLRRAMARFDAGARIVTYRLGFCLIRAR